MNVFLAITNIPVHSTVTLIMGSFENENIGTQPYGLDYRQCDGYMNP